MPTSRPGVPVIGLVGGVGSGKSYLAKQLQKHHPLQIVDADAVGHAVLKEPSVKEQIRRRFGEAVFDASGEIDRRRMGELVFGSGGAQRANRGALEQIVHPRITEILTSQIAAARGQPGVELVVLDAALLLEAGWRRLCDLVLFVDVPEAERRRRVEATRGWNGAQHAAREESQFDLARKRREADDVVDNSQSVESALRQIEAVLSRTVRSQPA
ncbi:MAG: dephospho-CoA kinase [Planctomycetales bacterium]